MGQGPEGPEEGPEQCKSKPDQSTRSLAPRRDISGAFRARWNALNTVTAECRFKEAKGLCGLRSP